MGTRSRVADRALAPFLQALHSSTSLDEVQATCAQFANELIPVHAYGWYQFKRDTIEPSVVSARGVCDRFLSLYENEGRARDPIFARVAAELRTISSDQHLSPCERRSCTLSTAMAISIPGNLLCTNIGQIILPCEVTARH
jgi:hypothetical protein